MTPVQKARIVGFKSNLKARGRDLITDTTESLTALVVDVAALQDPTEEAKQENPVYVNISCLAGDIKNPRAVGHFTEVLENFQLGRTFRVIEYRETTGDLVTWLWFCEAQRS